MAHRSRRARRLTAIAAVCACVAGAAASSAAEPVSLRVSPSTNVPAGAQIRLTARARLRPGTRLRITAAAAKLTECWRSPCVATYRGAAAASVAFRAAVLAGGKVQATSRPLTVRWRAAAPVPGGIAGDYEGRTTQNEPIRFVVDDERNLSRLEFGRLNEGCVYPDGNRVSRVAGTIGPVGRAFAIAGDGTFEIVLTSPTVVGSIEDAVSRITILGRMRAGTAVGTIREDVASPSEEKLSCTTGDQSWVASRS